ncbi:hypothetical protein PRIPAC_78200 [Pristionchus pacificus]|uniref:Uncharacterized protein n=1 Tax=Pristionchus pacificus TaxID=54126 RepID=A0A2A6CMN1_PRIPA|nr:hypothetical protein PRIPAC_78200 [Pristionchus pacificus]|eukprot:PDM79313.1 hypothetical protein PRIPAC_31892 [Pristionchus pacificus]
MTLPIVLLVIPSVALACIPTKTPEPGIPAVTPAPPICPMGALSTTTCAALLDATRHPNGCVPAMIGPASFACTTGAFTTAFLQGADPTKTPLPIMSSTCDPATKMWTFKANRGQTFTQAKMENLLGGGPLSTACSNPP